MNALLKNILIGVVGSLVYLAIAFFVVRPMISSTNNLNQELVTKKNQVIRLQQQIKAYQTAKSELAMVKDKEKVLEALPVKEELVFAIKDIEVDAVKTSSLQSLVIDVDPFLKTETTSSAQKKGQANTAVVRGLTNITEVPYTINTVSSYLSFIDFVSYLEHLPNFTEFSKFQVTAEVSGDGTHSGQVLGNINGVFFVKNATGN